MTNELLEATVAYIKGGGLKCNSVTGFQTTYRPDGPLRISGTNLTSPIVPSTGLLNGAINVPLVTNEEPGGLSPFVTSYDVASGSSTTRGMIC